MFALLPGNRTDTFIEIYIYKSIFRSISRGSRYGRAFVPTDLLTSLREEQGTEDRPSVSQMFGFMNKVGKAILASVKRLELPIGPYELC